MTKSVITAAASAFTAAEGSQAVARFNVSPSLSGAAPIHVRIEGWGATPGTDYGVLKVSFDGQNFMTVNGSTVTLPAGTTQFFLATAIASDTLSEEQGERIAFVVAQLPGAHSVLDGSYYVSSVATVVDKTPTPPKITGEHREITEGDFAVGAFRLDHTLAFEAVVDVRAEGYGITLGQDTSGVLQVRINASGNWVPVVGGRVTLPVGTNHFELRMATVTDSHAEHPETMNFVVAQTSHLLRESYYVSSLITVKDVSPASGTSNQGPSNPTPSTPTPPTPVNPPPAEEPEEEEPAEEEPAEEEPAEEDPVPEEPGVEEPGAEEPVAEEPPAPPATGPGVTPSNGGTFTVTESAGVVRFGGTATGEIVVTLSANGAATFSRAGITATTTVQSVRDKVIDAPNGAAAFELIGTAQSDTLQFLLEPSADPETAPTVLVLRGNLGQGDDTIGLVFPDAPGAAEIEASVVSTVIMSGQGDGIVARVEGADDAVELGAGSVLTDLEFLESQGTFDFLHAAVVHDGDPVAFTVNESNGLITFTGLSFGDEVVITLAADGSATFSRGGVQASRVVTSVGTKMIDAPEGVAAFRLVGSQANDTVRIRMPSESIDPEAPNVVILRGDMGTGSDRIVLVVRDDTVDNEQEVFFTSTVKMAGSDDRLEWVIQGADDEVGLGEGSVVADVETLITNQPIDVTHAVFIGVTPSVVTTL